MLDQLSKIFAGLGNLLCLVDGDLKKRGVPEPRVSIVSSLSFGKEDFLCQTFIFGTADMANVSKMLLMDDISER